MFKELKALDRVQHRALRLAPDQPYHFAAGLMVCPIMAGEVAQVARDYPIVFSRSANGLPMALLGVRQDMNAYVTPDGVWNARYIPVHVRRYPFMLSDSATPGGEGGERAFTVMFDSAAPHLAGLAGAPLFNPAGEPTELLQGVQKLLMTLQRDTVATEKLVQQIDAAGLLVERSLKGQPKNGKPFALEGLRMVDTQKLAECAPETLQELVKSGAMRLVYAHLLSMVNLQDGPLMQSNDRKPAAAQAPAEQAAAQMGDTISFAGLR